MSYSLYFAVCSVVISIILIASIYMKYRMLTKENLILKVLVWLVLLFNLLDLLVGANGKLYSMGDIAVLVSNSVLWLCRQLILSGYVVCVASHVETRKKLPVAMKIALVICNLYGIILLVVNLGNGCLFCVNEMGKIANGAGVALYYIMEFGFFIIGLIYLGVSQKVLDMSRRIALYIFVVMPYVGILLQYFMGRVHPEGLVMTLGVLWLYLNLPKADRLIDPTTNTLNQYALINKLDSVESMGLEENVLVIKFRDRNVLKDTYGLDIYRRLLWDVAAFLMKKVAKENVFYLGDARFVVMLPKGEKDAKENAFKEKFFLEKANSILKELQEPWKIYNTEITPWIVAALLEMPEDAKNINDIFNYLEYLAIMPALKDGKVYEGKHLDVAYMKRYDEIEKAIDRALQQTNFEVHYQPIYSQKENRIVAAEALLRMHDDEMGYVSPEEFIPIAEKNGKIVTIGHVVLESVCQFLQQTNIEDYGIRYIEVNLSTVECMQESLPDEIEEIMKRYDIDPSQINLEITETALAQKQEILAENMDKINEMGVTFSLDDYGTGYSTMTYMMTLPFKIVKIDKSILWSSFENERAMIGLRASIQMIREMNMEIVVEGVESEGMAKRLESLGCDYQQGFYYSRPLPVDEFLEFLSKYNK